MDDTVEPSLPAREINTQSGDPGIRTRNLATGPGIEPGSFRQTVSVRIRTMSQSPESPRQPDRVSK